MSDEDVVHGIAVGIDAGTTENTTTVYGIAAGKAVNNNIWFSRDAPFSASDEKLFNKILENKDE